MEFIIIAIFIVAVAAAGVAKILDTMHKLHTELLVALRVVNSNDIEIEG